MQHRTHKRIEHGNTVRADDAVIGIEYVRIAFGTEDTGDNPVALLKRVIAGKRNGEYQEEGVQTNGGAENKKQIKKDIGP